MLQGKFEHTVVQKTQCHELMSGFKAEKDVFVQKPVNLVSDKSFIYLAYDEEESSSGSNSA